ncbi:TIGR00730 family Rossman fold protein [Siminovitchia sediminis]|uniref:Cytokinin riboside 5'-monophosphate phosphoribohydrolase n=1 Tax=Siminovitchia sediminis TaxID=1274353 RepID=A0ABW4KDP0_9BACI
MKSVAVFCGSRDGKAPEYLEGAEIVGKELAKRNITLVYGAASVGMMGAVADAVLENGGRAIGVMPEFLKRKEVVHPDLSELIIVDSMHERKAKMADLADGFIALPGGPGTLEEFFEIYTWAQLGLHEKPCGFLNIHRYYDPLVQLFRHMLDQQFLDEKFRNLAMVDDTITGLLDQFQAFQPPSVNMNLKEDQT